MSENNVSNELIYEVLKNIQASIANLEEDTDEIKARINKINSTIVENYK